MRSSQSPALTPFQRQHCENGKHSEAHTLSDNGNNQVSPKECPSTVILGGRCWSSQTKGVFTHHEQLRAELEVEGRHGWGLEH